MRVVLMLLSCLKNCRKFHILFAHPGQNVICGTIDDPNHFFNFIGCQIFFQDVNYRNASTDTCFKIKIGFSGSSGFKQLSAMCGYNIFIRSNNMFTLA
jgi:hypothetical protein